MIQTGTLQLTAEDLLLNESLLQEELKSLFPFQSGQVSFPASLPEGMAGKDGFLPLLEAESDRLLVPLALQGRLLGIFIAQGVEAEALPQPAFIQRYSELCLENLSLRKEREIDPLTCLHRPEAFIRSIVREIEQISDHLIASSSADDLPEGECKGRFGIVVLEPDYLESLQRGFGFTVTERLVQRLAGELHEHSPGQAITARLENDRFGLLLPGSGPADCLAICRGIKDKLDGLVAEHPATGEKLTSTICCGSAVYPLHLDGHEMKTHASEQARIILDKSLHALSTARKLGGNQVFCFSDILNRGGSILSVVSEGRIRVDLGRRTRADEGHRFAVVRPDASCRTGSQPGPSVKAEVLLVEVGHEAAMAEILYLNTPFEHLCPGDRLLRLSPEKEVPARSIQAEPSSTRQASPLPLRHFLAGWQEHCREVERFSLVLCRMEHGSDVFQAAGQEAQSSPMAGWIDSPQLREMLPPEALIGEYGTDSLAFYLPGMGDAQGKELVSRLSALLQESGQIEVSIGLASYPCLQFTPRDMLTNARYALEHAQLLNPPRIAAFGSVTLTMIGDRHFTAQDLTAAAEHYGLALYLDAANRVARNSLGICHARLGNPGRAQREFEKVLAADPGDSMAWYNLGFVQLKQGAWKAAQSSFKRCLELVPEHVYARIRLGQLAEKQGDLEQAREIFQRAGQSEQGASASLKHLAKLDLQEGDTEGARSNLQQALVANPWDAEAQHLLARLYLETGEDVQIAESLAQKSVSLRPDAEPYRQLLERIFLLQNKPMQAGLLHTRQAGPGQSEPFTPGST